MKTKFSKRMLSLLLSALMITTSLPLTALTAFASINTDRGLVGEYLVNDVTTGVTNNGATWDSDMNAAHFNGSSSVVIDGTPLSEADMTNGFAVSFDVYNEAGASNKYFSFTGDNTRFSMDGSQAPNSWELYRTEFANSTSTRGYYTSDFYTPDYCSTTGTNMCDAYAGTGFWFNVTLNMSGGYLSYYIHGKLAATFKNNYGSLRNGNGVDDAAVTSIIQSLNTYVIGAGNSSGSEGFTGYIRDFRIYNKAIDTSTIQGAITMYENAMDGSVYTNMAAAYDKYVVACKAYDAYVYGEDHTIDINAAASELNTALGNMNVWVKATAGATAAADGTYSISTLVSDIESDLGNYSDEINALYAYGVGSGAPWNDSTISNTTVGTQYGSAVLMYDGVSTMSFPVNMYYSRSKSNRRPQYLAVNTDDFELRHLWHGRSTSNSYQTATSETCDYRVGQTDHAATDAGNKYYYSNTLYYTGSLSNSEYSKSISSQSWKFKSNSGTDYTSFTLNSTVYIVNYKVVVDKINTLTNNVISNVSSYKEGGLNTYLSKVDAATSFDPNDYFNAANTSEDLSADVLSYEEAASSVVSGLNNPTHTPDNEYITSYQMLRDVLDGVYTDANYNGTDKLGRTISESLAADSSEYDSGLYTAFTNARTAALNAMKAVYTSGYSTDVTSVAETLVNAHKNLGAISVAAPTISGNDFLGPNDTITITKPDGVDSVTYKLGSNASVNTTDAVITLTPFENGGSSITVTAESYKDGDASAPAERTYTYYNGPAFAVGGEAVSKEAALADDGQLTLSDVNDGTIEYSYDNETWYSYSAAIQPFQDNLDTLAVNVYARATKTTANGTSNSAVSQIAIVKSGVVSIASYTDGVVNVGTYTGKSIFKINGVTEGTALYYTVAYNGGTPSAMKAYNHTNYINLTSSSDFKRSYSITIKAYAVSGGTVAIAEGSFINSNFDRLIYRESFDDASFDGATFNTGSHKGVNGTLLKGAGYASVVSGAGDTHGWDGTEYDGSSSDWRENVLKFNATGSGSGNTNDNTLTLASNPIADADDTTKELIRTQGVTISFWRHFEGTDGSRVTLGTKSSASNTCANWRNIMYFTQDQSNVTEGYNAGGKCGNYFLIEADGYSSYTKTAGSNYFDYVPANQDVTSHAAGNDCGYWMNVVITINPNGAIVVYNNGDQHAYTLNVSSSVKTGNDAIAANNATNSTELINYLLNSNTKLNFNFANGWDQNGSVNDYDMYLDDIRIYAGVLSQVDIYNMYNDDMSDAANGSSTSHDPTNVTVYTLKAGTYTNTDGDSAHYSAGKTVGVEFIEYWQVDIATQVSKVEYYSFGTGMTIYKSSDNIHWTVVGDSAGNCGYQNTELFVTAGGAAQSYLTALDEPQSYVKSKTSATGAGYLVWAPHVMYNLTLDTWVYYAACSVWGTAASATFRAVSYDDSIEHYVYQEIVKQSPNTRPNVIDSCEFYGRKANGTIDKNKLYMSYGAWAESGGAEKDIVICELNPNGTSTNVAATPGGDDSTAEYICTSINIGNNYFTGEGSYIVYENGYYYLYVSYGENKGNYTERVFRAENPKGPYYDDKGVVATNNSDTYNDINNVGSSVGSTRGRQLLNAFYSPVYDYVYTSTGHNSIYKAVNNDGDLISLNACHARPYVNDTTGWHAIEDAAITKRQVELTGNITLINPVIYTQDNWPLIMPYQYNGTDTDLFDDGVDINDITGIYSASDLGNTIDYNYSEEFTYTIYDDNDGNDETAKFYGSRPDGSAFNYYVKLINVQQPSGKYKAYIELYNSSSDLNNSNNAVFKGAFAKHTENGTKIYEFGLFSVANNKQTWSFKVADIPDPDQVSAGDIVNNDGIIYTHEIDGNYTKYGREISDNFSYGKNNISSGERCTTFTTTYPYYVDVNDRSALYSMTSQELVGGESDYAGAVLQAVDVSGCWVDTNGKKYNDKQAAAAYAADNSIVLKRTYGITGMVSSYFEYGNGEDGGYPQTGVTILINYLSKDADDSNKYGEYKFFYVMPNPEWAHELIGIRNTNNGNGDKRTSNALYSRFPDSEGYATSCYSEMTAGMGAGLSSSNTTYVRAIGNFDYTSQWGTTESLTANYSTPSAVAEKFSFFAQDKGEAAGSYAWVEHSNTTQSSYGISPAVVDVNYYVDYSDDSQYGNLITVNNNVPTGYTFELRNSNVNWSPRQENVQHIVSWYRDNTGLTTTYNSTPTSESGTIFDTDTESTYLDINFETGSAGDHGSQGVHGMLTNSGIANGRAFNSYDSGFGATGSWNGTVTFAGKDSLAKNTDTSSAENYANYILASSVSNYFTYSLVYHGRCAEETYQYYNIGVSTCDKGAVRDFLEKYANKDMVPVYNSEGKMLYLEPGDGIKSDKYSVTSYNEYLAALAEAYFFLYNPHNTTYNGTGESAQAANSNTGEYEYVTAYRTESTEFTGYIINELGEQEPYTVVREANSALYDSVDLGGGNNIFHDDTVDTDPVQTRIIDNIVSAYLNLFVISDYTDVQTAIQNIIDNNAEIDPETGNLVMKDTTGYTPESIAQFEQAINLAKNYIHYDVALNEEDRENYWRYTDLTPEEYQQLQDFVETTDAALMPIVDKVELDTVTIPDKTQTVTDGIYTAENQTYTMSSWADMYSKLEAANTASDDCENGSGVVDKPKYNYGDSQNADILDTTYTYYEPYEATPSNYSTYQNNVNTANENLKATALVSVDDADAYETFDAAAEVVDTIDLKKYNSEAQAQILMFISQFRDGANNGITVNDTTVSSVYASSDLISVYNGATGSSVPVSTKLKNTTTGETDKFTTALLELTNTLNDNYINSYKAYLKIVPYDDQDAAVDYELKQTKNYGEMFEITDATLEGKNVVWSVDVYSNGLEEPKTATQKVSTYNGSTLMRKADADVKVTAVIVPDDMVASGYMVDIKDIYNMTVDVDYVSTADDVVISGTTLTVNGNTYSNPPIPFYTFNGWTKDVDDATKIITVTPNYSVETMYGFTAIGGTVSKSTARYDTVVTVTSSTAEFYAWAVLNGDNGKYQIVSYSPRYSFYVCASEDYVAVVKNGDSYETVDGVTLTASNVENPLPNSFYDGETLKEKFAGMTPDQFLNKKLDNKAPFVYIECKVLNQPENYGRVYVRVTEGALGITGYGVDLVINGASYTRAVDNKLPSGQFIYTARKASGLTSLTFKGYVTYDFTYSDVYNIAACDETSIADVYA